ncbi:DUF6461 domain-containing protein [Streptomyces sp. NBC_00356]|uniref:DUF6461 domain-containing protein n=1 Tax=Streptomyces sp. NBC_00356 TaxID=2975724 RepID=UPI002E26FDCD
MCARPAGRSTDSAPATRRAVARRARVALAHHVTAVRLTRRLLETAEFTCGLMTKPAPSWLRA